MNIGLNDFTISPSNGIDYGNSLLHNKAILNFYSKSHLVMVNIYFKMLTIF